MDLLLKVLSEIIIEIGVIQFTGLLIIGLILILLFDDYRIYRK